MAGVAGVVEIAGAGAAATGASELLGLSTALLAGFSATPWGLVLTLGGSIVAAGSALVLDLAAPWNENLLEIERGLDAACRQEIRGLRYQASLRLDTLLKVVT